MNTRKFFPETFFGRSLVIILIPILILQFVLIYFFYERHWEEVGRRLALALGGQISFVIDTIEENNLSDSTLNDLFIKAEKSFLLKSSWHPNKTLNDYNQNKISSLLDKTLEKSLVERISYPYKFNTKLVKNTVIIYVKLNNGVLQFSFARKLLYSSTIEVFIIWMLLTALFLLLLALYFMKQQIKPLRNIILAAEEFGRGNNNYNLKPRGAYELRLLSKVFIKMRERITNQISNRTQMLAGIGHDLRTPLTRMNLQIALLKDKQAMKSLSEDVIEMREMINTYLAYAKGEEEERVKRINIYRFIKRISSRSKIEQKKTISMKVNKKLSFIVKPMAMSRAIANIILNALSYSKSKVIISSVEVKNKIAIYIEDDGPGIPESKIKNVFIAFYRVDESRPSKEVNTGLGLTIAKNIIHNHGGTIKLMQSKLGGLKAEILIPT